MRYPPLRPPHLLTVSFVLLVPLWSCRGESEGDDPAPVVTQFAVYVDENRNGVCDEGDTLLVTFTSPVVADAIADDFDLPVLGDALGNGAVIEPGPRGDQVLIRLGANPSLKTRGPFDTNALNVNSPSGVDLSAQASPTAVVSPVTGMAATASRATDLVPGFGDAGMAIDAVAAVQTSFVGDLDGDGDEDLVLGIDGPNRVYLAKGGNFTDTGQALGASRTLALGAGDVNGDGRVDLVEGIDGGVPDRIWKGDGLGGFVHDPLQGIAGASTRDLALGDLDMDGDLDYFAGNAGPNRVYVNSGAGRFASSSQSLGGFSTEAVALGDMDGDGDLDALSGNGGGQPNRLYLNDRTGNYLDSGLLLGSGDTRALALGDIDGDGDLDAVAGNFAEKNVVLCNDGAGGFDLDPALEGETCTSSLRLADTDSDGDLDLLEGNEIEPAVLHVNTGKGSFVASGQELGGGTRGVQLTDVDADGDLDVIAVAAELGARLFTSSLAGTWGSVSYRLAGTASSDDPTNDVGLVDLNRDGHLDLVEALGFDLPNRVFFGDGRGSFDDSGLRLGFYETAALLAVDLDADGDADVATANDRLTANRVYVNPGNGMLFDSEQTLGASSSTSVAAGDLNGTGFRDLFFGNREGFANKVYVNSELFPGSFSDTFQALGSRSTFAVALGDLDQDGDLDAVTGNDGPEALWLNDGWGFFAELGTLHGSDNTSTRALALRDVDSDGDLDVMAGRDQLLLWRNGGRTDLFAQSTPELLLTGDTRDLALADVDGDGDRDIIAAGFQPPTVLINDGAGGFAISFSATAMLPTTSLVAADLDRDGDTDLLLGNRSQPNSVLVNE